MDANISRGYVQLDRPGDVERLVEKNIDPINRPPNDRCHCIYIALLLAGVGFLLPYNSFIIAVDYFQSRYPATTIVFDMSLIYILVALVAVIINNLLVETLSLKTRITFGYVVAFFTLLFVAFFEIWFELFDLRIGYYVNLLAVAVVSFGCTVQQSSFYGYTSMLPARYTQAVMTGESAAGLLVSTNRILTKALLENEKFNTIIFFCISIAFIVLCFVIFVLLRRSEFIYYYVNRCRDYSDSDDLQKHIVLEPTEDVGLVDMLDPSEAKCGKYGVLSLRSPPSSPVVQSEAEVDPSMQDGSEDNWIGSTESVHASIVFGGGTRYRVQDVVVCMRGTTYSKHIQWWRGIKRGIKNRWEVSQLIWPYMLSIGLAYFVTLCLFPGIESEIVSCCLGSWMPVILMAIFNFFDFIGKILASVSHDWTRKQLLLLSASRIFLVPLLALCAAPRGAPYLSGEGWSMIFSLLLGLSNGIAGSVPMIVAPSVVPDERKELTGNIMTLSYMLGLTTGSGVAYLIDYFLGPPLLHPCPEIMSIIPSTLLENVTSPYDNSTFLNYDVWNITIALNDTIGNSSSFL
ncbi:equilibrative nucleoside transporter 4-like [Argiope bruennichi]|uniref:Equilibrative nucleoside transporter 4 like protein n=1 Tax=Argiope bruennichi TaxID=94029 RepID=A0A8T0FK32_ARGBR|nr:equilibrative nucleoside transporter 4-like [Argiope bruennichi]KAF8789193.1 Equilibrative nucleoside transporter 4 like protein [Argiope bruennichi]